MWVLWALFLACCWAESNVVFEGSTGELFLNQSAFVPMIFGSQSFQVRAGFLFIGKSESFDLCLPIGPGNTTRRLLREGRIAIISLTSLFNRSCTTGQMATVSAALGASGVIFVTTGVIQISAVTWSTRYGRNRTGIPTLFLRNLLLADLLELDTEVIELSYTSLDLLLDNVTISNANSDWLAISSTYGYVCQVVLGSFAGLNIFLATKSIYVTVAEDFVQAKKRIISLAVFCLSVELLANVIRFVYYVVDPFFMWGTFPVEVGLMLDKGLLSLTLMTTAITALFWTKVVQGGKTRKQVTLKELWPWILITVLVLVLLEFLDGIVYITNPTAPFDDINNVTLTILAAVCAATAICLFLSGTFLLRKVRIGQRLQSTRQSTFQKSISLYIISELVCSLILIIWFLLFAWLTVLSQNNTGYWILQSIYFLTLQFASFSCILVYLRSPQDLGKSKSQREEDDAVSVPLSVMSSDIQSMSIGDQFEHSTSSVSLGAISSQNSNAQ